MEVVIASSIVDVTRIDSQEFSEKEHSIDNNDSNISKDVSRCDNKTEDKENIEANLQNSCDTVLPNSNIDCDREKVPVNEISNLAGNNCQDSEINLSKHEDNESKTTDMHTNEDNNEENVSRRFLDFVDSDSEEETNIYETSNTSVTINVKHLSKSSEDLENVKVKKTSRKKSLRRIDSESEDDLQPNNADSFPQIHQEIEDTNAKTYQTLIDSESEEGEEETADKPVESFHHADISENNIKDKSIKKRKGSIRASKNEAMRQIHSETQRLLRETKVSLPYHRPRQRTLQEFLNRKKITILPKAPSMAAKVKMSSAIVSQVVAEREKEAERFYKSSDSEDEMQEPTNKNSTSNSTDMKSTSMENEKSSSIINEYSLTKDYKQIENNPDSCIEEITPQNQMDVDTSRIFQKDCDISRQDKTSSPLIENSNNRESNVLLKQTSIENNQDLQRSHVSRKLFDSDCNTTKQNKVSDTSSDKQEITEQIIDTTVTSLDKENCNKKEQDISEIHDKEINETLYKKDCVTNNVTLTTSSDSMIQNTNNERQTDCIEVDETSKSSVLINDASPKTRIDTSENVTEEYQVPVGHVLGLPLPTFTNDIVTDDKLLPNFVPNHKVTLKGLPGTIIDLTTDVKPNKKGINALLDRFFNKHVTTKKQTDDKSEITVIHLQETQNGPVPIKEVLPYKLSPNIDNLELNKPGAKLKRLKEDLKLQMTLKRNEQWKQKKIEEQAEEKEIWDEEEESDYDLDKQKEDNNIELSEGESEPEENDICLEDKQRRKCLFADDEAEVTDDEDSNVSAEEIDNESDIDRIEHNNEQSTNMRHRKRYNASDIETDEEEKEEEEEEEEEQEELDLGADLEESGSDSQDINNRNICSDKNNANDLENENNQMKSMTDIDMSEKRFEASDSISENEYNIPVYQENAEVCTKSQGVCKTPLVKTSMLDFVSPVTQLSILNTTLDSNKKKSPEVNEYLVDKDESVFMESTQNDNSFVHTSSNRNKMVSRKRLFDDIGEAIDDEYLMKLCSGKFDSTQNANLNLKDPCLQFDVGSESQLPGLCSRNLDTNSADIKQLKTPEEDNETFQNIKTTLTEDSNKSANCAEQEKEVKVDSKLKLTIVSSDDDDQSNDADTFFKPKRRSMKTLVLSDSEEEEDDDDEDAVSDDEENDNENDENAEQYVDYDSEENEMIIVPNNDIKKVAAEFLEEEAELSESDWDSADEDEKDMDKLEFEEADDEHIDERKVKNELGKIHMKQMLDEDKREVRLLKELLFEDGDLHTDGTGRERKFKWRNIDKLEGNSEMAQIIDENDGWVDVQEDEEEAKWSKFRRERDKFLEERKKCSNNDMEDDLHDSKIFKLGLEALKKIENDKSRKQDVSSDKEDPSKNMEPIMPRSITDLLDGPITGKSQMIHSVMKKRSFLARGEESLARLASLAKQSDSVSHMVNTRKFVFQYIDPHKVSKKEEKSKEEKDQELQDKSRKRKNTSNSSSTVKKRRK